MGPRPVWLQFDTAVALSTTGTSAVDLTTGHLDDLQIGARTVVAIMGQASFTASSSSATPDAGEAAFGFITGSDQLVAADFPDLTTDGLINPGWMYRYHTNYITTGDGTNRIQTYNLSVPFHVKSKRSLGGVGTQALWFVVRVLAASDAGTLSINGQALLASKG